jgi:hypothetical protein
LAGEGTFILGAADDGIRLRRHERQGKTERNQTLHDFKGFLLR